MEKTLSLKVRTLREAAEMTQEDLAKRLGLKPPAISKWERGLAYPSTETLVRLAEIFGCTTDELLGRSISA